MELNPYLIIGGIVVLLVIILFLTMRKGKIESYSPSTSAQFTVNHPVNTVPSVYPMKNATNSMMGAGSPALLGLADLPPNNGMNLPMGQPLSTNNGMPVKNMVKEGYNYLMTWEQMAARTLVPAALNGSFNSSIPRANPQLGMGEGEATYGPSAPMNYDIKTLAVSPNKVPELRNVFKTVM